jgi:predicted nucleic acid-binding protein
MTFANLAPGVRVVLDANTLLYHFTNHAVFGPPCTQLLHRIRSQALTGLTAVHVLAEVAHRLMTVEAGALFGWPPASMANRLRRHPAEVRQLTQFRQAIDAVPNLGLSDLPVEAGHLSAAVRVSQQTGLLTNHALLVAVMQAHGLTHLASADTDFDRVPGLTRYEPA